LRNNALGSLRRVLIFRFATASLYKDELDQHVVVKDTIAAKQGTQKLTQGVSKFLTNKEALIAIAEKDKQEVDKAQQKEINKQVKQQEKERREAERNESKRLKNELRTAKKQQREMEAENKRIDVNLNRLKTSGRRVQTALLFQ